MGSAAGKQKTPRMEIASPTGGERTKSGLSEEATRAESGHKNNYFRDRHPLASTKTLNEKIRATTPAIIMAVSDSEAHRIAFIMYSDTTLTSSKKEAICSCSGSAAVYQLLNFLHNDASDNIARSFIKALESPLVDLIELAREIERHGCPSAAAVPQTEGPAPGKVGVQAEVDRPIGAQCGPPTNPACVVEIIHIKMEMFNCDRLFNLMCQYGNIVRIQFIRNVKGKALVQFADEQSVLIVLKTLNPVPAFGNTMRLKHSKHATIRDVPNPDELHDGTKSIVDYTSNPLNRFQRDDYGKKWISRPSKELFFRNAPTQITGEDLNKFFEKAGCRPPIRVSVFPPRSEKTSMGLLEWETVSDATEALIVANNIPIALPGSRTHTFKLHYQMTRENEMKSGSQTKTSKVQSPDSSSDQGNVGAALATETALIKDSAGVQNIKDIDPNYLPLPRSDFRPSWAVAVWNLDRTKFNCERLFNLFCLYGNIVQIAIDPMNNYETATICFSGEQSAKRSVHELHNIPAFGRALSVTLNDHGPIPETGGSVLPSDGSPTSQNYNLDRRNRYKHSDDITSRRLDAPSKLIHFYGAPSDITQKELTDIFNGAGAPPFVQFKLFQKQAAKTTAAGLLEWSTLGDAVEALVLTNHTTVARQGRTSSYTLKLCFSTPLHTKQ